jgi:hypothetical protein
VPPSAKLKIAFNSLESKREPISLMKVTTFYCVISSFSLRCLFSSSRLLISPSSCPILSSRDLLLVLISLSLTSAAFFSFNVLNSFAKYPLLSSSSPKYFFYSCSLFFIFLKSFLISSNLFLASSAFFSTRVSSDYNSYFFVSPVFNTVSALFKHLEPITHYLKACFSFLFLA